jgi:hypothetical protein
MAVTSRLHGLLALVFLAACGENTDVVLSRRSAAPSGPLRWRCPPEWVEHRAGGCGPAVLLCTEGGDAAPGACDGRVLGRPREINVDGQIVQSFFRLPDGRIGGGWSLRAMNPQCPEGWRHAGDGACEPVLPESCPEGSAPAPGGCLALGDTQCPSGEWPELPAEARGARVVYVRAGMGCTGEMGAMTCPHRSIAEGIRAAGDGGWVLVGAGSYTEALTVTGETHVLGVCATRVIVRASETIDPVCAVRGTAASLELRGVTVTGGRAGVSVSGRGRATLDRVRVLDVVGNGLYANDGELSAREVLVRGARRPDTETLVSGVFAENAATVTLERVAVIDSHHYGINSQSRARVRMVDALVRGVVSLELPGENFPDCPPAGTSLARYHRGTGSGLWAVGGGEIQARRTLVEETQHALTYVGNSSSLIDLTDSVLRRILPTNPISGKAVYVLSGGSATLNRVLVEDVPIAGLSAQCPGARIVANDCVVRNIRTRPLPAMQIAGRGLDAHHGGVVLATRTVVRDAHNFGAYAFNGSTVELTDGLIQGTRASADAYSAGAGSNFNATVRLRHVLLEDNVNAGVVTQGLAAGAVLRDVLVDGGFLGERGTAWGVAAAGGANLDADQLAVLDAFGGAIVTYRLTGSVSLRARNLYVRGVQPTRQPGAHDAAGVITSAGASVDLENLLVDRGDHGFAVMGYPYGRLSIRRGVFARQRRLGAILDGEPGAFDTLSLTDVVAVEVGDPYVRNTLD